MQSLDPPSSSAQTRAHEAHPELNLIDHARTTKTERERFNELYSANLTSLLAYAVRRAPTPEDAADAVSETFLVAWRRIDAVPPGEQARLWLYGTARRVLANQRRSAARRTQLSDRLRAELRTLQPPSSERPDDLDQLRRALDRLRPADRELLRLIAWEGLGPAELATVLDCSRNAAKIRTHRARRRLRRELAALDGKPAGSGGHESLEGGVSALPLETGETP
jgi:RNA polymerase sigma factor (sigma-70 family)